MRKLYPKDSKDLYLKDEGNFFTVIPQTKKAEDLIIQELPIHYIIGNTPRLDVLIEDKDNILTWATTHGLTINSEV